MRRAIDDEESRWRLAGVAVGNAEVIAAWEAKSYLERHIPTDTDRRHRDDERAPDIEDRSEFTKAAATHWAKTRPHLLAVEPTKGTMFAWAPFRHTRIRIVEFAKLLVSEARRGSPVCGSGTAAKVRAIRIPKRATHIASGSHLRRALTKLGDVTVTALIKRGGNGFAGPGWLADRRVHRQVASARWVGGDVRYRDPRARAGRAIRRFASRYQFIVDACSSPRSKVDGVESRGRNRHARTERSDIAALESVAELLEFDPREQRDAVIKASARSMPAASTRRWVRRRRVETVAIRPQRGIGARVGPRHRTSGSRFAHP